MEPEDPGQPAVLDVRVNSPINREERDPNVLSRGSNINPME